MNFSAFDVVIRKAYWKACCIEIKVSKTIELGYCMFNHKVKHTVGLMVIFCNFETKEFALQSDLANSLKKTSVSISSDIVIEPIACYFCVLGSVLCSWPFNASRVKRMYIIWSVQGRESYINLRYKAFIYIICSLHLMTVCHLKFCILFSC